MQPDHYKPCGVTEVTIESIKVNDKIIEVLQKKSRFEFHGELPAPSSIQKTRDNVRIA